MSVRSAAPDWEDVEVLLEYEGPQLVLLCGRRFIGVAAEEVGDFDVRWIIAPLSGLELYSLIYGGTSLRALLFKDPLTVADYGRETHEKKRVWTVDPTTLPNSALPEPGIIAPDSLRHEWAEMLNVEAIAESHSCSHRSHL